MKLKKSFTLFEVIISLVLLSVALSIAIKLFVTNKHIHTYYQLQSIENHYNESAIVQQNGKIQFQTHN